MQLNAQNFVSVCSLYLPPNKHIDQRDLDYLVEQLPKPFIIIGDCNAHTALCRSKDTNPRGRQIERMIEDHCLCLLNNGQDIYFHKPTRTFHTIDLAICSPSLLPFCSFSEENDPYNSNHFPIFVTLAQEEINPTFRAPHFMYDKI
ncbi:uncharacterized protein LOC118204721 [Stegodyphus dumicola]|uniref:uncharacterized protein LOC118204721 n=1 Tax=Stegodyphus dumicola TaxID=202533 RepID=UPI0015A8B6F5|nr:uncharacterized protein LOC118204721 [Stegodyphus dumicola]